MKRIIIISIIFLPFILLSQQWYQIYDEGLKLQAKGRYQEAIEKFMKVLSMKPQDEGTVRAYGTLFIDYFPNREIGICYYNLGDFQKAYDYLKLSLSQKPSTRASQYFKIVEAKITPQQPQQPRYEQRQQIPIQTQPQQPKEISKPKVTDMLKIAVLPFDTKGLSLDIGNMIIDKMITSLLSIQRFEVMERAELEKILQEQQLSLTGVVDASTAAKVGKGIGLDAIMIGSVSSTGGTVSIDARLIDTETASIITSKDAYIYNQDITSIKKMVDDIAQKIAADIPILEGFVVQTEGNTIYIDIGSDKGMKKGLKVVIYREGEDIRNPITGEVLGKKIIQVCEAVVNSVQNKLSICNVTKSLSNEQVFPGDKVITK
uniref:Uncharacterized protein n=1 Tax=candidate division WOR-3 bacterium TaxID=2052148 RepID=A0A7C4U7I6_UNCW3